MTRESQQPKDYSLWLPVFIGNIVPLFGVLFLDWDLGNIIILYWIENIIIGLWNIPRILGAGKSSLPEKLFTSAFFTVHYGGFCAIHGVFIIGLANHSFFNGSHDVDLNFKVFINNSLIFGALMMFLTIGWEFYTKYIKNGDYQNWKASKAMGAPYPHIIVIHLGLFVGAFTVSFLGSSIALLIFLIIGKSMIEILTKKKLTSTTSKA